MTQMISTSSCACSFRMRLYFAVITELDLYISTYFCMSLLSNLVESSPQIRFIGSLIG